MNKKITMDNTALYRSVILLAVTSILGLVGWTAKGVVNLLETTTGYSTDLKSIKETVSEIPAIHDHLQTVDRRLDLQNYRLCNLENKNNPAICDSIYYSKK